MTNPSPLESIYFAALEKLSSSERTAFLKEACAGNDALRGSVERMLAAQAEAGSFLEEPAFAVAAPVRHECPITERPGMVIGPYKLLQQIGEGGMGVVFMAEQSEPIQRTVALKIIKPGMDTRQVIARFEAERQAVAMMDHPNIARVIDAGATDSGRPYFVMELVKGVPITKYCDEKLLPLPARLELFMQVCQAVQHAHQKGIIHRDIKPNNVLVAEYDNQPVPKVIDFGVAKATAQKLTERTMFTEFGQVLGTMEYMSPEQSKFNQLDIDTRSDVYSLGVLLYELLAGSTPFEGKRLHAAAFDEMLRIIREEEPQKPSTRLSSIDTLPSVAANRHSEPARLSKDVRGELDWIVMKALEKDRNRRYETASGFAADIERHLHDEPVQACSPSAAYRLRKFARRNKVVLTMAASICLALIVGTMVSAWQAVRATRAQHDAEVARSDEREQRSVAEQQRSEADRQRRQAEANLMKAHEAVDQMLTRVSEERLADVPQMEPVRKALLEDAIKFYQGFIDGQDTGPGMRFETGQAYLRVAWIHQWLGNRAEAEDEYGKAIRLFEELAIELPGEVKHRQALSRAYLRLGAFLGEVGADNRRVSEAQEAARRGSKIKEQIVAEFPGSADDRFDLAYSLIELRQSLSQWESDRRTLAAVQESEAACYRAIELGQQLVKEFPAERRYQLLLGNGWRTLGHHLLFAGTGRIGEAEGAFRKAQMINDQLVIDFPTVRAYQHDLGYTLQFLSTALAANGNNAEAELVTRKALAVFEKLAADFPGVPQYRRALTEVHYLLATRLHTAGEVAEAEQAYRRAVDWDEKAVDDFPQAVEHQLRLAASLQRLGTFLLRNSRPQEAEQVYRKILELDPNNSTAHNDLARLLSTWPEVNSRDAGWAVELAKRAVDLAPKQGNFWNTLGVAHYRAGNWKAAVEALEKSVELRKTGDSFDWFFLAMAHWQLGHEDEARKSYEQALEWMEKKKPNNKKLLRFRAEAAELLGITEPQSSTTTPLLENEVPNADNPTPVPPRKPEP